MKTNLTTAGKCLKGKKIIATLIGKKIIASVLCILAFNIACAQSSSGAPVKVRSNNCIGLSGLVQVNANGYGSGFLPGVYFMNGRRTYAVSPVFQERDLNFSGMQFNFSYTLAGAAVPGYEGGPELYLFTSAAYHHNALLGKKTLEQEYIANDYACEMKVDQMRFRSVEFFGGAGVKFIFLRNFKWVNCVGIGVSSSLDKTSAPLYHAPTNFGITLRSGLTYDFR